MQRAILCVAVVLLALAGAAPTQAVSFTAEDPGIADSVGDVAQSERPAQQADIGEEHAEDEDEDEEAGAGVLGDWWGLGGEAQEGPYIGLVEIATVVLAVGVVGYAAVKRTSVLPVRYRRYQLQAHQWLMLVGTALAAPHFFAVEEWEGVGLAVALLLAIEVGSGLYGRYLHRHVIRLGRGEETPRLFGRALDLTKRTLFSRWRQIHVLLTALTAVVLALHIVVAVAD